MDKEKMTDFLKPGYYFLWISVVAFLFFVLQCVRALVWNERDGRTILSGLVGLAACVWTFWMFYTENKRFRRTTQELEQRGEMKRMAREFSLAKDYGQMRLGEKHVFVARHGAPIPYSEITRVYLMNKSTVTKSTRALEAVLANGKTVELCALKRKEAVNDSTLAQAVELIRRKNPAVTVGRK